MNKVRYTSSVTELGTAVPIICSCAKAGAGAIGRELSAQGGEQEKHRVKKASDAHDYFDLEEIAEDNAPAEPARDEENVPGAPPTNERSVELDGNYAESESNRANSGQGSTFNSVPPGFEASGGVLKFQATFMPQWRIPSIETIRVCSFICSKQRHYHSWFENSSRCFKKFHAGSVQEGL